jgi:hypothetical protein
MPMDLSRLMNLLFLMSPLFIIPYIVNSVTGLSLGIGRQQSAGVKGQLVCDGKPAAGVKVKLYDDDRGKAGELHMINLKNKSLIFQELMQMT